MVEEEKIKSSIKLIDDLKEYAEQLSSEKNEKKIEEIKKSMTKLFDALNKNINEMKSG